MGFSSWYRRLFSGQVSLGNRGTPRTLHAAAESGDAEAQSTLALEYSSGAPQPQQLSKAFEWYQKAADQNHHLAQFNLGLMLAGGMGTPRDDNAAAIWIRKAAEGGHAAAQFNLGMRFHRTSVHHLQMDAAESRVEAYKWFSLAAAQNFPGAVAACERVTLTMTFDEVADGRGRTEAFSTNPTLG